MESELHRRGCLHDFASLAIVLFWTRSLATHDALSYKNFSKAAREIYNVFSSVYNVARADRPLMFAGRRCSGILSARSASGSEINP